MSENKMKNDVALNPLPKRPYRWRGHLHNVFPHFCNLTFMAITRGHIGESFFSSLPMNPT